MNFHERTLLFIVFSVHVSEMIATSFSKALLIFATLLTCITVIIFFEIVVYVSIKVPYGARRGYTIFLLGLFPVSILNRAYSLSYKLVTLVSALAYLKE